jgi:hypothetical protein
MKAKAMFIYGLLPFFFKKTLDAISNYKNTEKEAVK